jgi:hypothetical protein
VADWPEAEILEWWPSHVRTAFANLGRVLGDQRLDPMILPKVSRDGLPDHQIVFGHVEDVEDLPGSGLFFGHLSGRELSSEGAYTLEITGPLFYGVWNFELELLQRLARDAVRSVV